MEGPTPLTERRLSSVIAPPWLQANKQAHTSGFAITPEEGHSGGANNHTNSEVLIRENIYPIDINHSRSNMEKRSKFGRHSECAI